jgi:hypothetical protein
VDKAVRWDGMPCLRRAGGSAAATGGYLHIDRPTTHPRSGPGAKHPSADDSRQNRKRFCAGFFAQFRDHPKTGASGFARFLGLAAASGNRQRASPDGARRR